MIRRQALRRFPGWLFAVIRLYFAYHEQNSLFSRRLALMLAARHPIDRGMIDYPDAMMMMTPSDVKRALDITADRDRTRAYLDNWSPLR